MIINEKPRELLKIFLSDYKSMFDIDVNKAIQFIKTKQRAKELTAQWYDELSKENIDYSVYDDDYYFTDLWNCWVTYSRSYLRSIVKSQSKLFSNINSVIDLGCGIGYTTSALKQIFPKAKVYGTNLKDTKQWKFCEYMSKKYSFTLLSDDHDLNNIDLVFASEYFEHIVKPIDHIQDVVEKLSPKYLIIANAFNTHSIGHFNEYIFNDERFCQSVMQKKFDKLLKVYNYAKVKTGFWNNRPTVWEKVVK